MPEGRQGLPLRPSSRTYRFVGQIAGFGSESGVRVVIGRWSQTPLGRFADAMIAEPNGRRILVAPDDRVAEFVSSTYTFDQVRIEPLLVTESSPEIGDHGAADWTFESDSLTVSVTVGPRTRLGWALHLVPRPIATSTSFATLVNPIAHRLVPGVRTRGVARHGRAEFYGANDIHAIIAIRGTYAGVDLGELADHSPPSQFGFSSTPAKPCLTSLVTTVRDDTAPAEPHSV